MRADQQALDSWSGPANGARHPHVIAILTHEVAMEAGVHPLQMHRALLAMGFAAVVPVTWGEELLARATLDLLVQHDRIVVSPCSHADVLLHDELEPGAARFHAISPVVATARYLRRSLAHLPGLRLVAIGDRFAHAAPEIDFSAGSRETLAMLARRGIAVADFPAWYENVLPPDRRRHWSIPGGCPIGDDTLAPFDLVPLDPERAGRVVPPRALILLRPRCSCASMMRLPEPSRLVAVERDEPPRATSPVLESIVDTISLARWVPPRLSPRPQHSRPRPALVSAHITEEATTEESIEAPTPAEVPPPVVPPTADDRGGDPPRRPASPWRRPANIPARVRRTAVRMSQSSAAAVADALPVTTVEETLDDDRWESGAITMEVPSFPSSVEEREQARQQHRARQIPGYVESPAARRKDAVSEPVEPLTNPQPFLDRLSVWLAQPPWWARSVIGLLGLVVVLFLAHIGIDRVCPYCLPHPVWRDGSLHWVVHRDPSEASEEVEQTFEYSIW